MSKKEMLANILCRTGILPVIRLIPYYRQFITIIAYHRIFNIENEKEFPFDPELISATVENFEWQIQYIKKHFYTSSFSEVMENIKKGKNIPNRTIIITFDDGHLDNYTNAFPILKKYRVPATIFLSTGYIGSEELFWFDEVAYILNNADSGSYSMPAIDTKVHITDIDSRRKATDQTLGNMKKASDEKLREALSQLRDQSKITLQDRHKPLCGNLTWPQVKEMSREGIEFGSHTVTHPILSKVGDSELFCELSESKDTIEEKISKPVEVLAYPVGGFNEYDNRVISVAEKIGYKLGVSYVSGINKNIETNQYSLKRLHVERYTSKQDFQAMLELPAIFS